MFELGLKTLLAYLVGAIIGSLVVGRLRGGIDIRQQGSGNAGGTNALRTQGPAFAFWVMLIDVGKGLFAVLALPALSWPGVHPEGLVDRQWLMAACAAAVVLGHVYPVWYEFRGGKGAATVLGVLLGVQPVALLPMFAIWLLTVMLTGYVGLGTVLAGIAFPLYLLWRDTDPLQPLMPLAVAMAAFVTFTHRSNIRRMLDGAERRAQRLWLLRPR